MGVVYLGYDPGFERQVAIKMLRADVAEDPAFLDRFRLEATTVAALDHPAIVPVHDIGDVDGVPFFVMRYMRGGSLARLLHHQGPVAPTEALRMLQPIADALDEAHARGVIHRDVKPGNILFDHRGDAFICDFGLVKSMNEATESTNTGVVGTAEYISPEMAVSGQTTQLSDIYSLGVTLFEMLTGSPPFEAATRISTVLAHVHDPVPDINGFREGLPPGLQGVIDRSMAKQPDDRYQTAGHMITDLNDVLSGAHPLIPSRPTPRRDSSGTQVLTREEQRQLRQRVRAMPLAQRHYDNTSSGRPTLASAVARGSKRSRRRRRQRRPLLVLLMVFFLVAGLLAAYLTNAHLWARYYLFQTFPTLEVTVQSLLGGF